MKKFLKISLWTIAVIVFLPIAIMLIWLTGNLRDEALNPELSALLAQTHPALPEANNAYFASIGLASPVDVDPHAWGVAWFKQVEANDAEALAGKTPAPVKLATLKFAIEINKLPCSNKAAQFGCLAEVVAQPDLARQHLAEGALLLQRFDALLDKEIAEPYRTETLLSDSSPRAGLSRASLLGVLRIALDMQQKHDELALAHWKNETEFLLRLAKNSHSLIDKLIVDAALVRYQKLLADYLATQAPASSPTLMALLAPFNHEAVSLQSAYESDAITSARTILAINEMDLLQFTDQEWFFHGQGTLSVMFLDRNATANGLASWGLFWSKIAALQGDNYRAALAQAPVETAQDFWSLLRYHNPIGAILLEVGKPNLSGYLYRTDEVLANKNLLLFALDVRTRKVPLENMAQEIAAHHAQLQHPYTGLLPVWDAQQHQLSYAKPDFILAKDYTPLRIKL